MQHDEVIWQLINQGHCTYKVKTKTQNFCRNTHNVTGLCNRSSCPLANSRYATIREHDGVLYLYMKSIERAHMPKQLWERVKLPRNYAKALELVDKFLEHWPKFLVHKNKQRLTKMTQYLIRLRKLALRVRPKLVTVPAKQVKRDARREAKAEVAAKLDRAIEKELLQRLQSGTYGDIYNFPVKEYEKVLAMEEEAAAAEDGEEEAEEDEGEEEEEDLEEEEEEPEVEYVEDYEMEGEEDDLEDLGGSLNSSRYGSEADDDEEEGEEEQEAVEEEDVLGRKRLRRLLGDGKTLANSRAPLRPKRRRPHVEVEYEVEREAEGATQ